MINNYFEKSKEKINVIAKNKNNVISEKFNDLNIVESFQPLDREIKNFNVSNLFNAINEGNITTQQLKNIDYSKFSNHVFFDSAVHKINYAFSDIINFPYDATRTVLINYLNQLDGYTKYVLDNIYPKAIHSQYFNDDIKIRIIDKKGCLLNDYDKEDLNTQGTLSPNGNNYNYTFNIMLDSNIDSYKNKNRVVFKKTVTSNKKINEGYICYVSEENEKAYINFCIIKSGIFYNSKAEIPLNINTHVSFNVVKQNNFLSVEFYIDGNKKSLLESNIKINDTYSFSSFHKNKNAFFIIGSGEEESYSSDSQQFLFDNFIGKIDDIVINKNSFDAVYLKNNVLNTQETTTNTVLHIKFNEPPGNYTNSALCIDHSGNKLHGITLYINDDIVEDTSANKADSLIQNEDLMKSPVIIGSYPEIVAIRNNLIQSATSYDEKNANLIFKMLPRHYFVDSANQQELPIYAEGTLPQASSSTFNKFDKYENTHITNICLIWARHFDQLKLYLDSLEDLFSLDYNNLKINNSVDAYMKMLCKIYGFDFKEILFDKTEQRVTNLKSDNIDINSLQNFIWKRILLDSKNLNRSKGTKYAIDSLFNSFNKNIKKFVNVRERSFNNIYNTQNNYTTKQGQTKEILSLDFKDQPENMNIETSYLKHKSNNIIETGLNKNWSLEVFFDFKDTQQKLRLLNSINNIDQSTNIIQHLNQNILTIKKSNDIFLEVECTFKNNYTRFCDINVKYKAQTNQQQITLFRFENINVFDVDKYLCITQEIVDNNKIKITCFVKSYGEILNNDDVITQTTTMSYQESSNYIWESNDLTLIAGNKDLPTLYKTLYYEGNINCIKLWKTSLSKDDKITHSKNIQSLSCNATKDLLYKNNIVFEFIPNNSDYRNILDSNFVITPKINDDSGVTLTYNIPDLTLIDKLFCYKEILTEQLIVETKDTSIDNVVKVISYESKENKEYFNTQEEYPALENYHEIDESYLNLLEIEMSNIKLINDDISKLASNINDIRLNFTGKAQLTNYSYNDLDNIRTEYFSSYNNDTFNYETIRNMFVYFDSILNQVLSNMIPGQLKFNGFNFVYESHVLERNKLMYQNKYSNFSNSGTFRPISYNTGRRF